MRSETSSQVRGTASDTESDDTLRSVLDLPSLSDERLQTPQSRLGWLRDVQVERVVPCAVVEPPFRARSKARCVSRSFTLNSIGRGSSPVCVPSSMAFSALTSRHAGEQGRCIILVLSFCGLRIGELAGLRVSDVNVARRRLTIDRSVTEVNGRLVWSSPKDGQRRSVPVPTFVMEEVEALIEGKDGTDLVFGSPDGHVLRVRNMRRSWFDDAARAAGLAGLEPHELRHTAASLAVSAGASVLAVQRMLGHSKPSITLDTYSDLFDADLDHVADRLHAQRLEQLRTG